MGRLTLLVDENITGARELLAPLGELQLLPGRAIGPQQVRDVDVLLVRSVTAVTPELLADSKVRLVGSATSGIDHIDRNYLQQQGISFTYAPGANANSVVEYVLAAIAASGQHLEQLLGGGRVGIVGFGKIGSALAARLAKLNIACCSYDPWLPSCDLINPVSLSEVLSCEVISLHAELTHQQPYPSHHLLGAAELAGLSASQLLINASRGSVIDNSALLKRLLAADAPQVVLDVWEGEPALCAPLLQQVHRGTAHIAGYSYDGKLAATHMLAQAVAGLTQAETVSTPREDGRVIIEAPAAGDAEFMRQLLQKAYDIDADDSRLRQVAANASTGDQLVAGFDQLRKTYAIRRELASTQVNIEAGRDTESQLLRQLGCIPVHQAP